MAEEPVRKRLMTMNDPRQLRIYSELAIEIGLEESIILLQIDFLIAQTKQIQDGRYWTYQSVRKLQKEYFPFWSPTTIGRFINTLIEKKLLIEGNFNKWQLDKTRWFALNEEGIEKLKSVKLAEVPSMVQNEPSRKTIAAPMIQSASSMIQNESPMVQFEPPMIQVEPTIPETTIPETTIPDREKAPRQSESFKNPESYNGLAGTINQTRRIAPPDYREPLIAVLIQQIGSVHDLGAQREALDFLYQHNYTKEQVVDCLTDLVGQKLDPGHWRKGRVSLVTVAKEIESWLIQKANPAPAFPARPGATSRATTPPPADPEFIKQYQQRLSRKNGDK